MAAGLAPQILHSTRWCHLQSSRESAAVLKAEGLHAIASYIWQNLLATVSQEAVPPVNEDEVWLKSAELLANDCIWATLGLSDLQVLADLVEQLPSELVPKDLQLLSKDTSSSEWAAVLPAMKPVLLLVQTFSRMHTTTEQYCSKDKQAAFSDAKQLHDPLVCSKSSASSSESSYMCHVRVMELLLKMLLLLTSIRSPDSTLNKAITSLRSSVTYTSHKVADAMQLQADNPLSATECEEAQALHAASMQMTLQASKQMSKSKSDAISADATLWSMDILEHLIPSHDSGILQASAHAFLSSGL